jgi:predicted dehydrogenase
MCAPVFAGSLEAERPVRVLLAGAGRWGTNIARSLREVPGAHLVALCDPDPLCRERLGVLAPGAPEPPAFFAELGPALELADAVIIAAPDALHVPLALRALSAGKHVLVEKPMALDAADAERLLARARALERTLMVGHVLNYHPAIERMQALLESGRLGRPALLQTERFVERAEPGDAWWNLAPHDLSLSRRLLGDASALWAVAAPGERRADVRALLDHGRGVQARLHVSHGAGRPRRRRVLLAGSDGTLVFDDDPLRPRLALWSALPARRRERSDAWRLERSGFPSSDVLLGEARPLESLPFELEPRALVRELQHFITAITRGPAPLTDGSEGLAVVKLLALGSPCPAAHGASALSRSL